MDRRYAVLSKSHNPENCLLISSSHSSCRTSGSESVFVPSLLLSNVMSLAPKIDANVDLTCITETWLRTYLPSNVVECLGPGGGGLPYETDGDARRLA